MDVYLDNSATTKVDLMVISEIEKYLSEDYGNPSSLYSKGQTVRNSLEKARKILAKKINASPEEIIFTSGGSESNNLAIKGYAYANKEKGNRIITSKIEHAAVLETMKCLEEEGFEVIYLEVDKEGFVNLKKLESAINNKTLLVSIMHANNEIGVIQDIESIGKICKKKGVIFHTDAVQSFTKENIDVKKQDVDLISFSAHKIHGPKGVGALYVKKGIKLKRLIDGGHQEGGMRAGTENVPGVMGFAKAVNLLTKEDISRIKKLRDRLMKGLLTIEGVSVNGSVKKRLVNNLNVLFKDVEAKYLLLYLDNEGICVSTGSACSSGSLEPSHVLSAIGLTPSQARSSIRFTLSKYNTEREIDFAIEKTKLIVNRLRKI